MSYQCNWRVWHWPWHHKSLEEIATGYGVIYLTSHFAGIGPFQWHWYS